MKKWIYKNTSETQALDFSKQAGIGRIFAYLLLNRNIDNYDDTKKFVYPSIDDIHDPMLLTDMQKAIDRITIAKNSNEKVTVFGDYDVDGLTSTSIMVDALSVLGINADTYIPDRLHEGYGLNKDAIKSIADNGTTLIITVDLGVTAIDEVDFGASLGVDFIITDHHQLLEVLPNACAVINPKRDDSAYPYRELAGVGVAFKLASALLSGYDKKAVLSIYIDYVCLDTLSDIVSLTGENRLFVKLGLKHFCHTKNIGIKALINNSGYEDKCIDETAIGFGIGPRINAAGRMGKVELALKLLTTKSENEAEALAQTLCNINNQRKICEQEILHQAIALIDECGCDDKVLVLAGKGWHTGVIGIVASRLLDLYYKPVIMLSIDDNEIAHGSARSVPDFNIFDSLCECSELLEKFGGHDMAAGLTIKESNIDNFRTLINEIAEIVMSSDTLVPTMEIDYEADPSEINLELAEKVKFFEPFGCDNPCPIFSMRNLTVVTSCTTKDGKHLRLRCDCMGKAFFCIGFNMGYMNIVAGDVIDIAFNLRVNEYNGTKDVNLIIKDILTD